MGCDKTASRMSKMGQMQIPNRIPIIHDILTLHLLFKSTLPVILAPWFSSAYAEHAPSPRCCSVELADLREPPETYLGSRLQIPDHAARQPVVQLCRAFERSWSRPGSHAPALPRPFVSPSPRCRTVRHALPAEASIGIHCRTVGFCPAGRNLPSG